MNMNSKKYAASADSVGDWNGNEEHVADDWNTHVLPLIEKFLPEGDSDNYDEKLRDLDYFVEDAWSAYQVSENIADAVAVFLK